MKKKTYVLMISRVFPATHPRAGEETHFMSKILMNFNRVVVQDLDGNRLPSNDSYGAKMATSIIKSWGTEPKLHTIRGNYDLWKKRIDEINAGKAVLSIREWSGSPYNFKRDGSKQVEFLQLEKVGIQRFGYERHVPSVFIDGGCRSNLEYHFHKRVKIIAKSDGLTLKDWLGWFPKSMTDCCVIHFTDFRY